MDITEESTDPIKVNIFKVGKWYKLKEEITKENVNADFMPYINMWADRKPRKCIEVTGILDGNVVCRFGNTDDMIYFPCDPDDFEEVPSPVPDVSCSSLISANILKPVTLLTEIEKLVGFSVDSVTIKGDIELTLKKVNI